MTFANIFGHKPVLMERLVIWVMKIVMVMMMLMVMKSDDDDQEPHLDDPVLLLNVIVGSAQLFCHLENVRTSKQEYSTSDGTSKSIW